MMDKQLGLLINFHVERFVLGVDRIVNKFGVGAFRGAYVVDVATDAEEPGAAETGRSTQLRPGAEI